MKEIRQIVASLVAITCFGIPPIVAQPEGAERQTISLDGKWQLSYGAQRPMGRTRQRICPGRLAHGHGHCAGQCGA